MANSDDGGPGSHKHDFFQVFCKLFCYASQSALVLPHYSTYVAGSSLIRLSMFTLSAVKTERVFLTSEHEN